ncbi:hypothetical protein T484DRAFT_1807674 [Baffinella frigidus]|nr:hypothetical protein T484DRAFT_1807674 [Cryptophyta sp. CCMP2293]
MHAAQRAALRFSLGAVFLCSTSSAFLSTPALSVFERGAALGGRGRARAGLSRSLRAAAGEISHISFDLDDTLWPTAKVVAGANADLAAWLLPRSSASVDGPALQVCPFH